MTRLTQNELYYGRDAVLPTQHTLRAGPLTVDYQGGILRNIRLGDVLVVQSIYAAVRNHNWDTVPGILHDLQMEQDTDAFNIQFTMMHEAVDFVWDGHIKGTSEGTITFRFVGEARRSFKRNRVGFCVQHPMQIAGQPIVIEHTDGSTREGQFPQLISPHQPYYDIRAVTHEVVPGVKAQVIMEGDTFEMEDQRNWTDASYKTYCTPLAEPFPVTVEAGTKIEQMITLRLSGQPPVMKSDTTTTVQIMMSDEISPLPPLGLGMADVELTTTELDRLRTLAPSHLRADLRLYVADWQTRLSRALEQASAINAKLELAIFVSDNAEAELRQLDDLAAEPVCRWLIFHKDQKSTHSQWVQLARQILTTNAPIGAGTDAFFTELNRERPPTDLIDFACYSLNPQVHAFDNDSLVETLPVQAETVRSTKAFTNGKPVVVSPVTLKMRWNPNATGPQPETPPGELPPQVDVRQMSLFGAGWTLGSIKYLAESGADSLTYYETVGWLGVMDHNNPLPDQFPAIAGSVYPLYHMLADIQAFAGGDCVHMTTSQPLSVSVLALRNEKRQRLLLANHSAQTVEVVLDGAYTMRMLDTETAVAALTDPESFRATRKTLDSSLVLPPYAYACLDREEESA